MRGAGGGTHSVVVYRLTAPMMGLDGGRWVGGWGCESRFRIIIVRPTSATLSILIRRFGL